ncbi:hypothetical protein SK128_004743 [Halocaridina rubra]|uniref:Uncharacterized protein n=1 Tax=Halocaridina rubra TaxID=373956 RepID=A0AAN8WED8_HALRR
MCSLTCSKICGLIMASLAIMASMATEGYYAWKAYQAGNECDPLDDNATIPDVCVYDELQVRSYIGLGEGIVGTIVSIALVIGFGMPAVSIIWVWVVWALGIASYNAYCFKDYHDTIKLQLNVTDFPWDTVNDEDYGLFFITAMTSLIWYGLALLIIIPAGAYLTHQFRNGNRHSHTFVHVATISHNNDAFEMENKRT